MEEPSKKKEKEDSPTAGSNQPKTEKEDSPTVGSDPPKIQEPPKKKEKDECWFLMNRRCRHGIKGVGCNFFHPDICEVFLKEGKEGCQGCFLPHVKICPSSLQSKKCGRGKSCPFQHLKGTVKLDSQVDRSHWNKMSQERSPKRPAQKGQNYENYDDMDGLAGFLFQAFQRYQSQRYQSQRNQPQRYRQRTY